MFCELDVYTIQVYAVTSGRLVFFTCTPVALSQISGISSNLSDYPV
jgi:hypothetical protein